MNWNRTRRRSKAVRPKFNSAILPDTIIRETVDELTLRAAEAGVLRSFINTTDVGGRLREPTVQWTNSGTQFVQPSTGAARGGMGELVLPVCRDEQGGQRLWPRWK